MAIYPLPKQSGPFASICQGAADAIRSIAHTYSAPVVVFLKFIDIVSIALTNPFGIRVSSIDGRLTFDSEDLAKMDAGPSVPLSEQLTLQIFRPQSADRALAAPEFDRASEMLRCISECLAAGEGASPLNRILIEGLSSLATDASHVSSLRGVQSETASDQLQSFFRELEKFLVRPEYNFSLDQELSPFRRVAPPILIFHRFVNQRGEAEARLQLLPSQEAEIIGSLREFITDGTVSAHDRSQWDIECADIADPQFEREVRGRIQTELSGKHWRIESCFSKGITTWVDWPWNNSELEGQQKSWLMESGINWLSSRGLSDNAKLPALLTPIHLGGFPWLGLVIIPYQSRQTLGDRARYFYRELLPYITTKVAQLAERNYLRKVQTKVEEELHGEHHDTDRLSQKLSTLSAVFPFPILTLRDSPNASSDDPNAIEALDRMLSLQREPNRGFALGTPPVPYRELDLETVRLAILESYAKDYFVRTKTEDERLSSYVDIGHTLKNVVASTAWEDASQRVNRIVRNFAEMDRRGLNEFRHDVQDALAAAARSLGMFSTVQGLGHFIRLAGARSGKFEWNKFSDWIDPTASTDDASLSARREYARSFFMIAQNLCHAVGWKRLKVSCVDDVESLDWCGTLPMPYKVEDLHFPPFRKGAEVGYVFIFAIAEPLLNAARALAKLPLSKRDLVPPLRIHLAADSDAGIAVTVVNHSRSPAAERISGWESTKHMLRDMGIVYHDLGKPNSKPVEGLHEISVTIKLQPRKLANRIQTTAAT